MVALRLWGVVGTARVRVDGRVRKRARVWRVGFMVAVLEVVELWGMVRNFECYGRRGYDMLGRRVRGRC